MDVLNFIWHLTNFVAPALGTAALCATLCKLFWRRSLARVSWRTLVWQSSAAGIVVLTVGLVVTGRDGKMATYAALAFVCAFVPWLRTVRR